MIRTPETIAEAKVKNMDVAKPQANSYASSASVSSGAVRSETAMSGHNVFRPDIYRVSEGVVI